MKHCRQLADDWFKFSRGSNADDKVEWERYMASARSLNIAIVADERAIAANFNQSWKDRAADREKFGLAVGMLEGLCHCVDHRLRKKIIKVLERIDKQQPSIT